MIFITGAAGFIGSALAWKLNRLGRKDLLLVDELGVSEKWRNLAPLRFVDYQEKDDFLTCIQDGRLDHLKVEALFHLGACSATTEKNASFLIRNNFEYTKILAEWCVRRKIRMIYASSAATYGNGSRGYSDAPDSIASLRPLNMYGYSKQIFDLWSLDKGYMDQLVGLKYFNVYGPNEYHKGDMKSMVIKAFQQILETGRVALFKSDHPDFGDGEQMRDFIYVKDAVDMTLFFLDTRIPGGIYNVGTGKARTWKDMMLAVFKNLGLPPKIDFIPMPEALRGKYQNTTKAEMEKMRSAGYAMPLHTLEEGIADYIPYLKNGFRALGEDEAAAAA